MWLGSAVAVAVVWVGSYTSNLTPSLGTSICCKKKKKKKAKDKKNLFETSHAVYPFFS